MQSMGKPPKQKYVPGMYTKKLINKMKEGMSKDKDKDKSVH